MKPLIVVLFILLTPVFGCGTEVQQTLETSALEVPLLPSDDGVFDLRSHFTQGDLTPGHWDIIDGSKICRGYLTKVESDDYCAATVPDDWESFTFNGQTYYIQPLAAR